jgi:hypothetical protein
LAGSGWAGAGLLGMVLGWLLLVHLPAKDKMLLQLVTSKDDAIKANDTANNTKVEGLVIAFRQELSVSRDAFRNELSANRTEIMQHCKEELARVVTAKVQELLANRQPGS